MSPSTTSILLLGAGELGKAFLPHLTKLPNTHITIGVRSPAKYSNLIFPSNLSLTPIDLASSPSKDLADTFSNYDILISCTGFGADPSSVLKLANEALLAGQIRRARGNSKLWFFPWQWGVDYDVIGDGDGLMPLFGAQRDVRTLLREKAQESNVCWTVIEVDEGGKGEEGEVVVRCLRDWTHRVTVTDVHDIGRVLAKILAPDSTVEATNRVVYVAGDTVSYAQLADIVERVSGKQVKREMWSMEYLKSELAADPDDGIKKYRLVFARDGVWWDMNKTVNMTLGMEMMNVETYARGLFSG
ncbi:unnamed protein product [Alternaria alternata]